MEFYELCRQTRDIYQSEPNREIELLDIQINFSKRCMKSDIEHKDMHTETKEYWKTIL
jgi:hypothetical protein